MDIDPIIDHIAYSTSNQALHNWKMPNVFGFTQCVHVMSPTCTVAFIYCAAHTAWVQKTVFLPETYCLKQKNFFHPHLLCMTCKGRCFDHTGHSPHHAVRMAPHATWGRSDSRLLRKVIDNKLWTDGSINCLSLHSSRKLLE